MFNVPLVFLEQDTSFTVKGRSLRVFIRREIIRLTDNFAEF
jgi:hypothetical protein